MEILCSLSPLPGKKHEFQPAAGRKYKYYYLPEGDALGQETGEFCHPFQGACLLGIASG